jgi:hypothetical protein
MTDFNEWLQIQPISADKTLKRGLQARIHDPYWLLARQFQLGEYHHDGGSTPVDVRVEMATGFPTRMRAASHPQDTPQEVRPGRVPLECIVEAENLPAEGLDGLRQRRDMGLALQRLLRAAGLGAQAQSWAERAPFRAPRPAPALDDEIREWFDGVIGRVPDGRGLANAVGRALNGTEPGLVLAPGEREVLEAWRTLTEQWTRAGRTVHGQWDPEQLEYRLSTAGMVGDREAVLSVPEYVDGTLDWYAFDVANSTLGTEGRGSTRRFHKLPVPLEFEGMPESRFWTMEDPEVRFDALEVLSGDEPSSAAMFGLEFALSYGDDWFLVPLPLEPHLICDVKEVAITDCFGDVVFAQRPAGRWNMFRHDGPGDSGLSPLFFHAAPGDVLEGDVLEALHLLRDEQANIAWAVEAIVPHPLGEGRPSPTRNEAGASADAAELTWTLAPADAPRSWFPLLPVAGAVERLRLGVQWTHRDARPFGRLAGELVSDARLRGEEVPAEGAQVVRRWQSSRAADGSLHVWIGRNKLPRQEETARGTRFDTVE